MEIVLSEYPDKSHNFRNFVFMTSHFSTLWRARHPSRYAYRASFGFGNLPVSKGVFMQKTSTKGVACERTHLCELGKNFVGSARRLISKSNFCRGRFPFVTVTLTVRSPRTGKGEKIRSCITVTVTPRSLPSGAPNGNFRENICSEDDLRTRSFGTFVVKFLACLPLLGFSNIYKMV